MGEFLHSDHEGFYHQLPKDIISQVIVNEQLTGMFANPDIEKVFLSPEVLKQIGGIFSLGESTQSEETMPQLISPSGRRSATIGRSVDPALVIASLGYTELTANGTRLTKRAAKERTSEIGIGLKPEDPLG